MKRMKVMATILCAAILVTECGCGAKMPNVSDEDMKAISEYAAVAMLKYDAGNRSRLVDDDTIAAYDQKKELMERLEKAPSEETTKEDSVEVEEKEDGLTAVVEEKYEDQLMDFYQFPQGVNLTYTGYEVLSTYPEGGEDMFSIDATDGKKLLVLKFALSNSGEPAKVDIFGLEASYRITVNRANTKGIMQTLLLNDLSSYVGDLSAGKTEELVLVTEMEEDVLAQVDSIVLKIKNASNACTISLK